MATATTTTITTAAEYDSTADAAGNADEAATGAIISTATVEASETNAKFHLGLSTGAAGTEVGQ
jgi:hypothetical protein